MNKINEREQENTTYVYVTMTLALQKSMETVSVSGATYLQS